MVLLLKEILMTVKSKYPHRLSLLGGLIFSFTPWSFIFSRTGFESGMALCMIIWATYGILNYQRTSHRYRDKWWQIGLVVALIAGAMYVYHSSKITAPLILILTMALWWRRKVVREMNFFFLLQTCWLGLLLTPLIRDSLLGNSLERANTLFISDASMSWGQKISLLVTQVIQQFKPSFLIGGETGEIVANGAGGGCGVLLIPTLILCLIALVGIVIDIKRKNIARIKWFVFAAAIILIGFLPAAMGEIIPHSNRALSAVLGWVLLAVYGLSFLLDTAIISVWKRKSVWLTTLLLYGIFIVGFLNFYFKDYAKTINAREGFLSGYVEAAQIANEQERYVERIVFSDEYAQAYIFQLFAKKIPAINWQGGHLGKYAFLEKVVPEHFAHEDTLFVVGPKNYEQFYNREIQQELFDEAGQSRWRMYLIEANV
jgi:hypothetical protein